MRIISAEASNLRSAMHDKKISLVLSLSRAHLQDALSQTDDATKERFVAMIETFQPVLMVMDGPAEVEPLDGERRDIGVQLCMNFREIAFSEAARPWLEGANATQDEMHSGDVIAQTIRRVVPRSGQRVTNAAAVGSGKQRDVDRRRERSDWVDLDHVAHFPYVDLATCDAGTFPLVTSALRSIETPRIVTVVRNGRLGQVAEALRSLS